MNDYLIFQKTLLPSETFGSSVLERKQINSYGFQKYELSYVRPIEVWYNEESRIVRVKGSIPYFWSGHNYSQCKLDFIRAINYISKSVNIDLLDAIVSKFEYGKTILVPLDPRSVIDSQLSLGRKKPTIYDHGKVFKIENDSLKIYNAGKNYKNKLPLELRKVEMKLAGMDLGKNYIRIENSYSNPQKKFNRLITVRDLTSDNFNRKCRRDLYMNYKRIKIVPYLELPKTKKLINTTTIPLIALIQLIEGYSLDIDFRDLLWNIINNADELSIHDKKARKRQLAKALNVLSTCQIKEYDMSTTLIRKLASDRY